MSNRVPIMETDCCIIAKHERKGSEHGKDRVERARARIQTVANEMSIELSVAEALKFALVLCGLEDDEKSATQPLLSPQPGNRDGNAHADADFREENRG